MLLLVLALGCTGSSGGGGGATGDIADYVLTLTPVVASNQPDVFASLDKLDLVLDPDVGDPRRVTLGEVASGESGEITDLPALDATSIVVEGYSGGRLAAWGRTEPLTADSGEVDAKVFVAENDGAAWLSALPEGLYRPVLAALGDGRFLLAGGLANNRSGEIGKGQDTLYELSLAPPGDTLGFEAIGSLPSYLNGGGGDQTNRFGATFTPLTVAGPDQGKVLLVGGSDRHPYLDDSSGVSQDAMLYDPATGEWDTDSITDAEALNTPRTLHLAIENVQGNVVVWGGWVYETGSYIGWATTVEVYDRAGGSFEVAGEADIGELDAAAADLGTEGTLICGGIRATEYYGAGVLVARDECIRVSPDGRTISDSDPLPRALAAHAMVTLADGRVLVTGGVTPTNEAWPTADYVPASDAAWILDPSSGQWATVGPMKVARAGHRMALLPDGRVLVAGGAQDYHPIFGTSAAVSCIEVFDPDTTTFTMVNGCSAQDDAGGLPGRAFQPEVAVDPVRGALIVGGRDSDNAAQNGVSLFVSAEE